ncbi:MAG TPA: protein translocase subunit SecF [Acidimicrobiia bacterium]|nr:protein translocase subunit SecF [Acidimicrobiia bacterium]
MSFRETLSDIFHERTNYDFIGPKKKWFMFSGALILIGLAALGLRGLNLGIEFKGGTSWEVEVRDKRPTTQSVRDVVEAAGLTEASVQLLGRPPDSARVESRRATIEEQEKVRRALAEYANVQPPDVSINDVGPSWGDEVSEKALRALVFFFLAIAAYLSLRFEPKMAAAALMAVIHDIFITVGAYALTGFPVTPATVIAFLTILGFSLYDTVVVFDKIDENVAGIGATGRETYSAVANRSMNEVLMRSLNTSITAVLPVLSLLIVGAYLLQAATLKDFALALFIGLLTGAYSSIFVATPFLAVLKEREPRYTAIRQKLAGRAAAVAAPAYSGASAAAGTGSTSGASSGTAGGRILDTPEGDGEGADSGRSPRVAPRPVPTRRPGGAAAPRPRQKRRKR